MAINPTATGIHHIGLRSMNFERTKNFYQNVPGFLLIIDTSDLLIFAGAGTYIAFKQADPRDKKFSSFSPFEVGPDHIAMTCEAEEALHRFAEGLADAGVKNTGLKADENLNKLYVDFKDPERIAWEFYMK